MPTSDLCPSYKKKAPLKLPVLGLGSSGSTVRVLQQLLNFKGFTLEVDGEFDSLTREAVKDFQCLNGLTGDGIVDAKTWQHLSFGLLELSC
jgi:peptidoglycan hydrolase-like protein with peptidoglycan-binding domain